MPARNYIELIDKSMRVLEVLSRGEGGHSLKDIATEAGLVKSSAFRILFTFRELGYVERLAENGTYGLTLKVLSLARSTVSKATLVNVARPFIEELREQLGESVWLAEMRGDFVFLIDVAEGYHPLRLAFKLGNTCPLHATALGKVIAAELDEERLNRALKMNPLERFTPHTITDAGEFSQHIEQVKRQGYALNIEETIEGAALAAAPIRDAHKRTFAAVSISLPTARWDTGDRSAIISSVERCGESISQALLNLGFDST